MMHICGKQFYQFTIGPILKSILSTASIYPAGYLSNWSNIIPALNVRKESMEVFGPLDSIRSDEKLKSNIVCTQLPEKCQDFQEKYKTPESVNTYNVFISKLLRIFFFNLETSSL